ncbi:MAG: sugar nucleotide-binding protein [Acidobacteria bacterium]|nr:sugar nucleotide-binding protein [Acidobacteriota bacterium]
MENRRILLTGGSGKLGRAILASGRFSALLSPPHRTLDIAEPGSVMAFCAGNDFEGVIHCAAQTDMAECETNPLKALAINLAGTCNLVTGVLAAEKRVGRKIRFIHISTDGVYPGQRGHYSEGDETIPYNRYGWSKLGAECAVHLLSNWCIIRTSFFDPSEIRFEDSAVDAFSSKVTIDYLVRAIAAVLRHDFVGTVNIGGERKSYYERYRGFKPSLKPCAFADVAAVLPYPIARDSSMDCTLWRKLCLEDATLAEEESAGV